MEKYKNFFLKKYYLVRLNKMLHLKPKLKGLTKAPFDKNVH